jgi:hypothetical protein
MLAAGTDCYGQRLDTFDDADDTGGTRGLSPTTFAKWHISPEMHGAVESYLSGKTIAEQVALSRLMAEVEQGMPTAPRSKTTTLDMPFLQQPGAGRLIALEWAKRLGL